MKKISKLETLHTNIEGASNNKIVLINLPSKTYKIDGMEEEFGFNPSFALISLGTWLELNGYEPILIDLCCQYMSKNEVFNILKNENPIIVGLSVHTENTEFAMTLARLIKIDFPSIKIVFGGAHPTLVPDDIITSDYVDFIIRKEGEATLLELTEAIATNENAISFEKIPGLLFKRNSKAIKNSFRAPINDLDIMPLPKREFFNINRYSHVANILTGRGCPGNCVYCAAKALSGSEYRSRAIENVILEIILLKYCMGDRLKKISILDDTFTVIPERVIRFVELLNKYKVNIPWRCASRIDILTEEFLDIIESGGCTEILYGIESGCQEVLDKIKKQIDLDFAKKMIKYTYKKGILPILSFIFGHYCDTKESMGETLNFIRETYTNYKAEIAVFYNTPYPGTWQYINKDKLGIKIVADKFSLYTCMIPIIETENFSLNDLREFYLESIKYSGRSLNIEISKKNSFDT